MMAPFQAPFALLLRYFSQWFGNYGLALIGLALLITAIRIPFDIKAKRSTMKQTILTPKIKAIQERFKNDPRRAQMEIHKLYKDEGVKMMGGCVWMILPMLIMILLFGIIREPLTHLMGLSYEQIEALRYYAINTLNLSVNEGIHMQTSLAGHIYNNFEAFRAVVPDAANFYQLNMNFLSLPIGETPQWNFFMQEGWVWQDLILFLLPIISVGVIYLQQKIMMAGNAMQSQMMQQQQTMKMMMLMMPIMSLWIGFTFPAAMTIYWTASGAMFTIASIFISRHFRGIYKALQEEMDARDQERQAALDAKRAETERKRQEGKTEENKATSKKKKHLAQREKELQRQAALKAEERADDEQEENPSRVGHRKYARGRAYDPCRFDNDYVSESTSFDLDEDELLLEETQVDISPTVLPAIEDDSHMEVDSFFEDDSDLDDEDDYLYDDQEDEDQ